MAASNVNNNALPKSVPARPSTPAPSLATYLKPGAPPPQNSASLVVRSHQAGRALPAALAATAQNPRGVKPKPLPKTQAVTAQFHKNMPLKPRFQKIEIHLQNLEQNGTKKINVPPGELAELKQEIRLLKAAHGTDEQRTALFKLDKYCEKGATYKQLAPHAAKVLEMFDNVDNRRAMQS